jgi:hypothetical protein
MHLKIRSFELVKGADGRVSRVLVITRLPSVPTFWAAASLVGKDIAPQITIQAHLLHFLRGQDPNALHTIHKLSASST